MALLRESGPVPGDENGVPKASKVDATKKKSRGGNKVRLATPRDTCTVPG